ALAVAPAPVFWVTASALGLSSVFPLEPSRLGQPARSRTSGRAASRLRRMRSPSMDRVAVWPASIGIPVEQLTYPHIASQNTGISASQGKLPSSRRLVSGRSVRHGDHMRDHMGID